MQQKHYSELFSKMRWIDGRPLMDMIVESYRLDIFEKAWEHDDSLDKTKPGTASRVAYNMILCGRAKKNWKTGDLILWSLYKLLSWLSWAGNQVYILANDEDQAGDDLELAKKIIAANGGLGDLLTIKSNIIERKDGKGFIEILPAGDVVGTHGKTFLLCAFDEIHGYKSWDILEAMQLDPSRPDAQLWLTSYASLYHKPGVPLFDLTKIGREGKDPRMLFSWYSSTYTTDPDFQEAPPEQRANPSMDSWEDPDYLEQQRTRLPSHKFRRLHLNEPGLPEGSAYSFERIDVAIERGVKVRPYVPGVTYHAFVDMSGGSSDDATLAISHLEGDGDQSRAVLDVVINQGPQPPFNPRNAVTRFAKALKEYKIFTVSGDKYGGETFISDFELEGISYEVAELTKSELYEALEPRLNANRVILLDHAEMESQFLSLIWRGGKIDHPGGEHDDYCNAAAGAVNQAFEAGIGADMSSLTVGGGHLVGVRQLAHEFGTGGNPSPWPTENESADHLFDNPAIESENSRRLKEGKGGDDDGGWFGSGGSGNGTDFDW